ncbi:hypothetical protein, partial [Stenotrophomonas maltophilia]|uniref:hypothetical protein n=1 Tax=Stenotrophomonas maltophilia TaxID=40324 RepID=UPI00296FABD7
VSGHRKKEHIFLGLMFIFLIKPTPHPRLRGNLFLEWAVWAYDFLLIWEHLLGLFNFCFGRGGGSKYKNGGRRRAPPAPPTTRTWGNCRIRVNTLTWPAYNGRLDQGVTT